MDLTKRLSANGQCPFQLCRSIFVLTGLEVRFAFALEATRLFEGRSGRLGGRLLCGQGRGIGAQSGGHCDDDADRSESHSFLLKSGRGPMGATAPLQSAM
jgi:hypothetical protein